MDAEETDLKKVVILLFGNTLSFIGYMIATRQSFETTMTIQIEAGARNIPDINWVNDFCKKFLQQIALPIYQLPMLWTKTLNGITDIRRNE